MIASPREEKKEGGEQEKSGRGSCLDGMSKNLSWPFLFSPLLRFLLFLKRPAVLGLESLKK